MNAISQLPQHQQQEFQKTMEEMTLKDSLMMYNNVVEKCFDECVTGFRSKMLDKPEALCVENCTAKFVKTTHRVGLRFAEHQALMQQKQTQG